MTSSEKTQARRKPVNQQGLQLLLDHIISHGIPKNMLFGVWLLTCLATYYTASLMGGMEDRDTRLAFMIVNGTFAAMFAAIYILQRRPRGTERVAFIIGLFAVLGPLIALGSLIISYIYTSQIEFWWGN